MVITKKDIEKKQIKEIPVCYGNDEIRIQHKAITLNEYILSGVDKIKIEDKIILFLGTDKEILRTKIYNLKSIRIDESMGVYIINRS